MLVLIDRLSALIAFSPRCRVPIAISAAVYIDRTTGIALLSFPLEEGFPAIFAGDWMSIRVENRDDDEAIDVADGPLRDGVAVAPRPVLK